jgi:hypothetical protein
MPIENPESDDGIVNFILTAIARSLGDINTSNMATITAISEDKTLIDVTIDTTKVEVPDIPFVTLSGGGAYLQFPISVGDKCLIIFSKDTVEDWLSGNDELVFNSDFDINNGFALVGINDSTNAIDIKDYVDFKVSQKIMIYNDTDDMVSLISDTIQFLSDTSQLLSTTTVVIPGGSSAGTYPLSTAANFIALQAQIDALKVKFDTFKV